MPEVFDGNYPSSETVFSGNSARNSSGLGAPSETVPARVWASGTVAETVFGMSPGLPFGKVPGSVFIVGVYRLKQFSARSFMPGFGG